VKSLIFGWVGLLAFPVAALGAALPPDTQADAARIFVVCSVTDQETSKNCRFYAPIDDPSERLKAGTELGFLDTHPFSIPGADPGADVKVLVRLKVSAVAGGKGFDVSAAEAASPSPAGAEIKDPVWVVSPHASWTAGFVPERAFRTNQTGEATVRCEATEAGTLVNCWVRHESPTGFGFGEAALLLLQHARMKPLTASGAPVAGRAYVQTFKYAGQGALSPQWSAMSPGSSMSMSMMGSGSH